MKSFDKEYILSTLAAMCEQEETVYKADNYLRQSGVYAKNRSKLIAWCYRVVDCYNFDQETLAIAINYLDRFPASPFGTDALNSPRTYQLVVMTSLYTAIKIHEPKAITPDSVVTLSRGMFTAAEVEAMEMTLLQGLKWRVNPPTALAFVREFMRLLPVNFLDPDEHDAVYEMAKINIRLVQYDSNLHSTSASVVAVGALMYAYERLGLGARPLAAIFRVLSESINRNEDKNFIETQRKLSTALWAHPQPVLETTKSRPGQDTGKLATHRITATHSPRSVYVVHKCHR